jgi:hypothetical protein
MIKELRENWTLIFIDFADLLQKPSVNLTLMNLTDFNFNNYIYYLYYYRLILYIFYIPCFNFYLKYNNLYINSYW